jgi:putative ABC transport system permease protein
MLLIYLKQAWRALWKNKTSSLLNIIGLSASLTCFILIAVWVIDETSYDKFNSNYSRIYRIIGKQRTQSEVIESAVTSAPMSAALKNDYPEVEEAVRMRLREELTEHNGEQLMQPNILLTDPSFFHVFSYHLTKGDERTALNEPFSIILTKSAAKKYFGEADPMGQSLKFFMYDSTNTGALYKVTGVIPDPPKNAHFTFTMLASFKTIEVTHPDVLTTDGWGDGSYYTYVLLKPGVDANKFSKKIVHFFSKYIGELAKIWEPIYSYQLQPLADIHLRSNLKYEMTANGNINNVYIFSTVGVLILLLAGINYVNLSTARSVNRAKEVGIKKVLGAGKTQLVVQYLMESVLTALMALLFSFFFSYSLQPLYSSVTDKDLSLLSSPLPLFLLLIGVAVCLGVLAGFYPAVLLTRFNPALVLKGSFKSSEKGILLRKALVTAQFVITISLISGIVIIYSQMKFIQSKDLGYDKDQLLFMRVNGNTDVIKGFTAFKNDLQYSPLVKGVTTSNSIIVGGLASGGSETVDAKGQPLHVNTSILRVDSNYFSVYGIQLVAGSPFTEHAQKEVRPIILNEKAVKNFGWKNAASAIGMPFKIGDQKGVVIGVAKDFNFSPLQHDIEPLSILPVDQRFSRITVKFDTRRANETLAFVESTWKKHFPSAYFDFDFVSQQIKEQYQAEERFSGIFFCFSILSLLIGCLGLYGLIAYTITQKTKEIGIRKVLGAEVNGIVTMLSSDFIKLVALACLISVPVSWYVMNQWLLNFAYRISIEWWMFVSAGLLVLVIALITVSARSIRVAMMSPVKSLRME